MLTNRKKGVLTKFIEDDNGLTYVEVTEEGVIFVQAVIQNYEWFTKKEVYKAVLA